MNRLSVDDFRVARKMPLVLVLDNVRSLNNIGSVFRTSDAFALAGIAICGISACPPSPEIHKTALGAEDSVQWQYFKNTDEALSSLREDGYVIVCLEQVQGSVLLQDFVPDRGRKYALIIGNEVDGVAQSVVDMADICLEIPQSGTKHSLNVSVSAALAIWQFYKTLYL